MSNNADTFSSVAVVGNTYTSTNSTLEAPQVIEESLDILHKLGIDYSQYAASLSTLYQRQDEGRFHLAVLGQFKRGKSTFINALLGEHILPTSVIPLTAIPTFIRHGIEKKIRVVFEDKPDEIFPEDHTEKMLGVLSRFVSEEANPENRLGVSFVEIYHTSPILSRGLVLIDTPGIGSTHRHNTETTLNFLPQCDGVFFLVSADPPVTETEISFLKEVLSRVNRVFFILNKIDYLSLEDRTTAFDFFRQTLHTQCGLPLETPVYGISSRRGLEARLSDSATIWNDSGMRKVETLLLDFLMKEKSDVLKASTLQKTRTILSEVLMRVNLGIRSLYMPLEDLEKRLAEFDVKLAEIDEQRQNSEDLLSGDRKRMNEYIEARSAEIKSRASTTFWSIVENKLNDSPDEKSVQNAIAERIPSFFEHEMGALFELTHLRVEEVVRRHEQRTSELIDTIRRTASELFEIPCNSLQEHGAFEMKKEPYWVTHKWNSSLFNLIPPGFIDRLLPTFIKKKRLKNRFGEYINSIVMHNVENMRWATIQNLDRTFLLFSNALKERFNDTITATRGAIETALVMRNERGAEVADEIKKLEGAASELNNILASIHENAPKDAISHM